MRFFLFIFLQICLFAADFDCIVIGTSPFSLFEALYQYHSGHKVLILEEASSCGGAWKSIDICGVPHVDLGCHQVGNNMALKAFLEEYAGCKIVSMDNPLVPFESGKSKNGWYFSHGCCELIDHLLQLIAHTEIVLYTNCKAESVSVDSLQKIAAVSTNHETFTANKLIVTPMSCIQLNAASCAKTMAKSKYCHLYLLIQDPTPFTFTYQSGLMNGVSRVMNLTHFAGLSGSGRQLIVVQTHNESGLKNEQAYLNTLKAKKLIDPSAYILRSEPYIYEAGSFQQNMIAQAGGQGIIELLQTGHFDGLANYISKWKQVLKPFDKVVRFTHN